MKRSSTINRKTNETNITMSLGVDGSGKQSIDIPLGFLTHMLELFCRHGLFDLTIKAQGDTFVDEHHTVEEIGIVLGQSFAKAWADKKGIERY